VKRGEMDHIESWVRPLGMAQGAGPEDDDAPLATLWIPDPEQRRGWRERYVYPDKPKPNGKPIGFRR
jgi:hypothetical protein